MKTQNNMIEFLELLWKRLNCDHIYEITYTVRTEDTKIIHYVCINCGKTKTEYGEENN